MAAASPSSSSSSSGGSQEDLLEPTRREEESRAASMGKGAVLLALAALLPTLAGLASLIGWGRRAFQILGPYLLLHLLSPFAALYARNQHGIVRWIGGLVVVGGLSGYKSALVMPALAGRSLAARAVAYAVTALWECSNAVPVLSGAALQDRYGLASDDGIGRFVVSAAAPCQVKFGERQQHVSSGYGSRSPTHGERVRRRSLHIALAIVGGVLIATALQRVPAIGRIASSNIVLEVEALVLFATCFAIGLDLPSHLWQVLFDGGRALSGRIAGEDWAGGEEVLTVLPYGFFYACATSRQFWARWSRPATSFVRYLFFHPLGGSKYWCLSIPLTFFLNAGAHYDLSGSVNADGDRCEVWWNAVFGTLALGAMLEVGGDGLVHKYFCAGVTGEYRANHGEPEEEASAAGMGSSSELDRVDTATACMYARSTASAFPLWYRILRGVLAHLSLRVALFLMIHYCFKTSLGKLIGGVE